MAYLGDTLSPEEQKNYGNVIGRNTDPEAANEVFTLPYKATAAVVNPVIQWISEQLQQTGRGMAMDADKIPSMPKPDLSTPASWTPTDGKGAVPVPPQAQQTALPTTLEQQIAQGRADVAAMGKQLDNTMGKVTAPKSSYQFEEPVQGTMMTGTGIPGIYQMPDGSYVNTPGREASPQQNAVDKLNQAIATISRDIATLPSTGVHAADAATREKDLAALAGFSKMLTPQQTAAPAGAQVVSVDAAGNPKIVADNRGTLLQHAQIGADALKTRTEEAFAQKHTQARTNQLQNMHRGYTQELSKIEQNSMGPDESWNKKRTATRSFLQSVGVDPETANIPFQVDDFLFEQQLKAKQRGQKLTPEKIEFARKAYNEVLYPKLMKEYQAAQDRFLKG
jgi:hypothetical protein